MSDTGITAPVAEEPIVPVAPAAPATAAEPAATSSEAPVAEAPAEVIPSSVVEPDGNSASEPIAPAVDEDKGLLLSEAKLEEPKPAEAQPTLEAPEPVVPLEPIKYEPFTLPEGVTLNDEGLGKFTELVGEKLRLPQDAAQQLMDLGIAEIQRVRDFERAEQQRVWTETRRTWRNEILADEEIGGANFETSRAAAARILGTFVPEERRAAFNQALIMTGMTDNPEFFRFLVNIAQKFDEPSPSPAPRNPPPDIGRNPRGGRRLNYDNPTSPRPNGAA